MFLTFRDRFSTVAAVFSGCLLAHEWHCNVVCAFLLQAEMERALLQGEREAELEQIEAESMVINQLQHKLDELEDAIQREKDKVHRQFCTVQVSSRF